MRSRKLTLLTAMSLVCAATPALAAPPAPVHGSASASRLSLTASPMRTGKPVSGTSSLTGSNNGLGIAMLAVVLAGAAWAAYEMIDGDDDEPASP